MLIAVLSALNNFKTFNISDINPFYTKIFNAYGLVALYGFHRKYVSSRSDISLKTSSRKTKAVVFGEFSKLSGNLSRRNVA